MTIALVPPIDPKTFLSYVKTVTPQIGKLDIAVPTFILLAGLQELPDAVKSQIGKHVKTQKKKKDDNIHVVKVSDAVECVNKSLRDPQTLFDLTKSVMAAVTNVSVNTDDALGVFADKINDCIRGKALSQKSKRTPATVRYWQRPAKGHGKGRKGF